MLCRSIVYLDNLVVWWHYYSETSECTLKKEYVEEEYDNKQCRI